MTGLLHSKSSCAFCGAIAVAWLVPTMAMAQDYERGRSNDSERQYSSDAYDRDAYDSQERDRQARDRSSPQWDSERSERESGQRSRDRADRQEQGRSGQQLRLEPLGWVRVATDTDGDGAYDDVDWIYYYDLQMARERSRQRDRDSQQQQVRVRGEIQKLRTMNLDGQQALVATLQTDQGDSQRVCLKPKDQVSQLDLQQGDRITAEGRRDRVNDRRVVMARSVTIDGQTVNLRSEQGSQFGRKQGSRSIRGEIVSKRTTTLDDRDGRFVLARVHTDEGETKTVNLGSEQELKQLGLQSGDRITVQGHRAKPRDEADFVARQISAGDQTVRVGQAQSTGQSSR
jgi:antitoxin component of MazEF toxin-antitoxin module